MCDHEPDETLAVATVVGPYDVADLMVSAPKMLAVRVRVCRRCGCLYAPPNPFPRATPESTKEPDNA